MRARRALLYVPGDDRHKMEKAAGLNADCICLDLEDGVAVNRKSVARHEIYSSMGTINFGKSERLVRVNSISSGICEEDLDAILPGKPDGIYLPKVSDAAQIQWINEKITDFERQSGISTGTINLVAGIESALGILHLPEICQASSRLTALVFGAEDYMADIGGLRSIHGLEMLYARSAVVIHAVAFEMQAIDMVCTDYKNEERLIEEARFGMSLGFSGKQVIHPSQVAPVQKAFTPDPIALEQAARIVRSYQENLTLGKGAFTLDEKMIDMPVVKAAERLLARAKTFV